MSNYAIILAAGDGKRLGSKTPKCFIKINNQFVYEYSLEKFISIREIKQTVLVVPKQYVKINKTPNKKLSVVCGGKTRNESFEKGIKALKNLKQNDKILIHDAARINVCKSDILKLIKSKQKFATLCYIAPKNNIDYHIGKYNIQTPQMCLYSIYKKAKKDKQGKDLLSYLNLPYKSSNFIISSNKQNNRKITLKKDLI